MHFVVDFAISSLIPLSLLATSATEPAASIVPVASASAVNKSACEGAEFRQFDFWIGEWTVRNPAGKEVGRSEISREAGGCAIREQWKSAASPGMSINYYDAADGRWHQDWVGGDGTILHLRGGLEGEAMVLSGEAAGLNGTIINKITWTPLPKHEVKQEWAASKDSGKTWQVSFVGIYSTE